MKQEPDGICKICGQPIMAKWRTLYCSNRCAVVAERRRKVIYRNNPAVKEKQKENSRVYRSKPGYNENAVLRTKKWRQDNRELYNQRHKEYRARKKLEAK
jgi:hypothetical protein